MKLSKIQITFILIFTAMTLFCLFGYRYAKDLLLVCVIKSDLTSKDKFVTYLSTTDANWDYVQKSLGGLKMDSLIEENHIVLKPNFLIHEPVQINSMHCIRNIAAKQIGDQIRIKVKFCLCNEWGVAEYPYAVSISKPKSGEYTLVYNDSEAGYPVIGHFSI
jgi:hypothetical protein